ncbi:ABC transporter [Streptomyces sp. NPDC005931]|uniref:ABC transporter n=1 Tax=Streptomyces sp. NPDC005931 TaxID=3364737 RepID=UPI0036867AE8
MARTVPWRSVGAAGGVGLLLAGVPRLMGDDGANDWLVVTVLRAAAVAFALGLAFLLDDPARHTTAAVPTRWAVRHTLRVALVAPVAALWWTVAVLLVPEPVRPPVDDVTLEAAATFVLALAGAAFAVRRGGTLPGRVVAGALLVSAVLAPLLLPGRWELFTTPGEEGWAAAHDRWALLLGAAVAVGAACAAEPVRRRPWGRGAA